MRKMGLSSNTGMVTEIFNPQNLSTKIQAAIIISNRLRSDITQMAKHNVTVVCLQPTTNARGYDLSGTVQIGQSSGPFNNVNR